MSVLQITLSCAVPLLVEEMKRVPLERLREEAREEIADVVASQGDVLQFGSKKKGEAAKVFNKFARGVAILSFSPGGVTVFGDHYENKHPDDEREAEHVSGSETDLPGANGICQATPPHGMKEHR